MDQKDRLDQHKPEHPLLNLPVNDRIRTTPAHKARIASADLCDFADEVLHSDDLFPKEFCIAGFLALWKQNLKTAEPLYRLSPEIDVV